MARLLAIPLAVLAFHSSVAPVSPHWRAQLTGRFWHKGCPVTLGQLRVLSVTYWGFDGKPHSGGLVVNERATKPLSIVFAKLYALHFPIRHLTLQEEYGPANQQPQDGDISGSFECRNAVPSPCDPPGTVTSWSEHAYGEAVDINPLENPYVGCGMTHDPAGAKYLDRKVLRKGMVTPEVIAAFRSVGWGWGGSWSGNTHDYMHFSATGH
jgi:hypothetical protein